MKKIIYIVLIVADYSPNKIDSHTDTINFFREYVYRFKVSEIKNKNLNISILSEIFNLKKERAESDYKNKIIINRKSFDYKFGDKFFKLEKFIDDLFFEEVVKNG